ncbi:hypothetical protein O6H91_19G042900 [Diphasiastrum complanatum]|uniref:Uncharacterized protein n=1 Tax=Diphasiastrum complanatum TaxID=34168 RepID=A0ACC2AUZ6_DIPCM|nr:hypothetical protein O6H91_19G042900 [Diphasiastrum complanatum]
MEEEGESKEGDDGDKREIGKLAVWSVSSAKPGNGVDLLRDSNYETYWQSDGAQPHLVNIQFQKKVRLKQIAIYVDFKHDESYTPNKISVRAGNSFYDLREIKVVELVEPVGWVNVSLCPNESKEFLRAFLVQLAVLSNHQNGRDTHIRQIKIYGPRQSGMWIKVQGSQFDSMWIQFKKSHGGGSIIAAAYLELFKEIQIKPYIGSLMPCCQCPLCYFLKIRGMLLLVTRSNLRLSTSA